MNKKNPILFRAILLIVLIMPFLYSCYDDKIDGINKRLDEMESRIESQEELTKELQQVIAQGKIINKITPVNGGQGWQMHFSDGFNIIIPESQELTIMPIFRIDQAGHWLYSHDNGTSFLSILDPSGNMLCADGPEATSFRMIEDETGFYKLEFFATNAPETLLFFIETPYKIRNISFLKQIILDNKHHITEITTADGSHYRIATSFVRPSSIAIQSVRSIKMARHSQASIEFRVNPSNASLNLESGEDVLEIDRVGIHTRANITASDHVRLTNIEQVYDPNTLEIKEGQYRAVLTDVGNKNGYDESFALVLTCMKGSDQEYQVSSSAFEVERASVENVQTGLPILMINTPNMQTITSRYDWMEGADLTITTPDANQVLYQGKTDIKGRGNTSWGFPKKPFSIRLNKKSELLGMKEQKRWCLLANWADRTLIRNAVAFELAKQTDLDWTPSGQFVEVVLNGEHIGNYYLCEQVRIDENRLNLYDPRDGSSIEDRGYIFELDIYYDEPYKFTSNIRQLPWMFKDPSTVTQKQKDYVEQYVEEIESALYDSTRFAHRDFANYIDLSSFVDYWLIYELSQCNEPNHPKSVFMHKDAGGKMKAGPVWDFDMSTFNPRPYNYYTYEIKNSLYYDKLFADPEFKQLVKEHWSLMKDKFSSIDPWIDQIAETLRLSDQLNHPMWPITISDKEENKNYDEAISALKQALSDKIRWLDSNIAKL